jgi:hypothetical protein
MPVIYATSVKTSRMNATRLDVVDGTLELLSAGDTVLAIFTLSATAGSVTGAVWTLAFADADNTVSGEAGAGSGTAATKAQIKDDGGTVVISGLTVALSSADIILDNTSIAENQSVVLTSATITHAPDPS